MGNFCSSLLGTHEKFDEAEDHRKKANELGEQQRQLSARSQAAYKAGNGALAKQLSNQAKDIHAQVEYHNKEAARLHYVHNNSNLPDGTIDLHGLFVKEAIQKVDAAVSKAKKENRKTLTVIVGAGNHSIDRVQRIRPAVEKWCRDRGHTYTAVNQGCLSISLREKRSFCTIM